MTLNRCDIYSVSDLTVDGKDRLRGERVRRKVQKPILN